MPVLEVSQVVRLVRDVLEREVNFQDIWVEGEIANLARPGSGHCYCTLRDTTASVRCVKLRFPHRTALLANGAYIIAHGRTAI